MSFALHSWLISGCVSIPGELLVDVWLLEGGWLVGGYCCVRSSYLVCVSLVMESFRLRQLGVIFSFPLFSSYLSAAFLYNILP